MKSSWRRPPAARSSPAIAAPSRLAWWCSSPASWSRWWLTASTRTDRPSPTSAWCFSQPGSCFWRPAPSAGRWSWRGRRSGGGKVKPSWSPTRGAFSPELSAPGGFGFQQLQPSGTCFWPQNTKLWRLCWGLVFQMLSIWRAGNAARRNVSQLRRMTASAHRKSLINLLWLEWRRTTVKRKAQEGVGTWRRSGGFPAFTSTQTCTNFFRK